MPISLSASCCCWCCCCFIAAELPLLDAKELLAALARYTAEVSKVKVEDRLALLFGAADACFVVSQLTRPVVDDIVFSANPTASRFSDMLETTLGLGEDGIPSRIEC